MNLALLVACYLLGSIPWGLIIVRLRHGVDVRTYGSGSTGTTNVLRTAGGRAAVLVLLLDALKGVGAVLLARWATEDAWVMAGSALAVLVGHIWPVFAGFRGGRGVATGEGALLALCPLVGLIIWVPFIPILAATRYMSLASIVAVSTAAVSLAVLSLVGYYPTGYILYAVSGGVLILFGHRANVKRLLEGRELKLGQRKLLDPARGSGGAR